MTKKLMGLFMSVTLMGSGAALAGEGWKKHDKQQTQSQGATGGSGQSSTTEGSATQGSTSQQGSSGNLGTGQSGSTQQAPNQGALGGSGQVDQSGQSGMNQQTGATQQLGANELTGRVVKSGKKMIWVEHMGAIVPLTINKDTQFGDESLKRAQDLKEGDQVRASFEVRKTENIVTNLQKAEGGTGGSGHDDFMGNDPSINQDPGSLPPSPVDNTGGSGSDLTPPDIGQEGTGSDLGSDANMGEGSRTGDY